MIRLVEALDYRCLRYIRQELRNFQVLVGPNASGKSAFLDVVAFLGDLLQGGPLRAVEGRVGTFRDLVWMREGSRFELAIEMEIPNERRKMLKDGNYSSARYEVAVGLAPGSQEIALLAETLWLKPTEPPVQPERSLFPMPPEPPETIVRAGRRRPPSGWKKVVNKIEESGNDYFMSETSGWNMPFRLGPQKAALANLPEDEERFPVATWFKRTLMEGVQTLMLNSAAMRRPSPPGVPKAFQPDGSNLPWVIERLDRKRLEAWIAHVRTALPDLAGIRTIEREDDRSRYLALKYESGVEIPSWSVSDGTLRLLALTLLAYLPETYGVFLIEEPENGIHPRAVETVFHSLASVYGAQVLLATHSPVILSVAQPEHVLCFAKSEEGATDIVAGSEHPALRDWQGETNLGVLFASGVLG